MSEKLEDVIQACFSQPSQLTGDSNVPSRRSASAILISLDPLPPLWRYKSKQ